jgi:hypothetical protein
VTMPKKAKATEAGCLMHGLLEVVPTGDSEIERMAKAMHQRSRMSCPWLILLEPERERFRSMARAAREVLDDLDESRCDCGALRR